MSADYSGKPTGGSALAFPPRAGAPSSVAARGIYCFTDPPTPTLSDRALIGPASALPTDSRPTWPKISPSLSAPRCPPQVAKSSHDLLTDPHKFDILRARPWQATAIEAAVHLVSARGGRGRSRGGVTPTSNALCRWRHVPRDTARFGALGGAAQRKV